VTEKEFTSWVKDYFVAFPASNKWLNETSDNPLATLRVWSRTLQSIPLEVAATVTDRMVSGEIACVPAYDREQTALIIRSYANRIISDNRSREQTAQERELTVARSRQEFPAGLLYASVADARAEADKLYPHDPAARDKYYDEKFAEIWTKFVGKPRDNGVTHTPQGTHYDGS
jgi:hypothetical protein